MARRTRFAGLLCVAVVFGVAQAEPPPTPAGAAPEAQAPTQLVPIPTVDGVDLAGTYYRGNAGRDTPCVLMVHKYGGDSSKTEWVTLARELNAAGYAVLTFDLRGHGKSTTVDPAKFWVVPNNRQYVRPTGGGGTNLAKRTTIAYSEFQPRYLPMLVNDILAARRFLEIKNDAGELNTNSIVVVGAQEGATLGLLFAASEFARIYKVGFVPLQSEGTRHNAGEDIAAGVWLSLTLTSQQGIRFNGESWFRAVPALRERVPMRFIYGERDRKAKEDADAIFRTLTANGREKPKNDDRIEVKGTDLAGVSLLGQPTLDVNQQVVKYVKDVLAQRKAIPWSKVDPDINRIALVNLRPFGF